MELTPSQIAGASFRTVRKGYDPDEVNAFLGEAAQALEAAQQQATAMEARARAAVARLQEVSAAAVATSSGEATPIEVPRIEQLVQQATEPEDEHDVVHHPQLSRDEAETISRTLLLAQHTADTTVAEAEAEAERIKLDAQTEAEATIDSTREMSARLLEEARGAARTATKAELEAAENEVQSLKARREFLVGDVDQLEQFMVEQRDRLRGAARQIEALVERVPAGLGPVHPPVLSASDDEPGDDTGELFVPPEARGPFATADELADAVDQGETQPIPMPGLFSMVANNDALSDSAEDLPLRQEKPSSD